jgi:Fe-S oxidoreductase
MNVSNPALGEFRERLESLGHKVSREQLSDGERVTLAKSAWRKRLNGRMAVDLETCIHCGMCAEACHFYEATEDERYAPVRKLEPLRRFYRRELSPFRWFFRPFTSDITADELREWQPLVYDACTGCGRCDMMCPMGISLSPMIRVMREGLAAADLVPDELQALDAEQRDAGTVFGVGEAQFRDRLEELRQEGVEVAVDKDHAEVVVLTSAIEVLLFPESLAATAKIMGSLQLDWTFLSDAFDATNVGLLSGDDAALKKVTAHIVERTGSCNAKTLIVPETGHAYQALRWEGANELGEALPFEVLALSEFLVRQIDAGRLKFANTGNGAALTYHDPCRLGRHGGVYEEPRKVLAALGTELRETDSNRRENYCCGGGCAEYVIRRAAPLRQKAFAIKQREFDETQATAVVTSCANCRLNLMNGAETAGWKTPVTGLAELVAAHLPE